MTLTAPAPTESAADVTPNAVALLTSDQLDSITSLAACASKDDVTPVLGCVEVRVEEGVVTAVATDRYVIGRVRFTLDNQPGTTIAPFHVNIESLAAAAKGIKGKKTFAAHISLSVDESPNTGRRALVLSSLHSGGSARLMLPDFNFPPVERLFPDREALSLDLPDGTSLDPTRLANAAKVKHPTPTADKNVAWHVGHGQPHTERRQAKGLPLLFTRGALPTGIVDVLVQPNLLAR